MGARVQRRKLNERKTKMLRIEYREQPYYGTRVTFWPDDEKQIPGLKDMLEHNFQIENPAKTFGDKMKSGGYEGVPEDTLVYEAERVNYLSDIWDINGTGLMPSANVMQVLCRMTELYVNARMEIDRLKRR